VRARLACTGPETPNRPRRVRRSGWQPRFCAAIASHAELPQGPMRRALLRNIYAVTAATVGLVLLCVAVIDWVSYTVFAASLTWWR